MLSPAEIVLTELGFIILFVFIEVGWLLLYRNFAQ